MSYRWRAGRASDVATTIVNQWEGEKPHNVEEWRNLSYLKIYHKSREVEWVGEKYEGGLQVQRVRGDKRQFDIVILAIGFGDERDNSIRPAVSYWRNDPYAQPDLSGRQKRYLVSGTGDGGLVDLLRLRITDSREDRTGHQLADLSIHHSAFLDSHIDFDGSTEMGRPRGRGIQGKLRVNEPGVWQSVPRPKPQQWSGQRQLSPEAGTGESQARRSATSASNRASRISWLALNSRQ